MRYRVARDSARSVEVLAYGVFRECEILSGQPLADRRMPSHDGKEPRVAASQGAQQASHRILARSRLRGDAYDAVQVRSGVRMRQDSGDEDV